MDKCFDIGVMQAFVDGELSSSRTEAVVRHLSVCEACSLAAAEVEADNDSLFEALGTELDYMVPTERLREKVFSAIENEEKRVSAGFGWFDGFRTLLTGQMATAFGALVICIAAFGVFALYSVPSGENVESAQVAGPTVDSVSAVEIPAANYSTVSEPSEVASVEAPKSINSASVEKSPTRVRQAAVVKAVSVKPVSSGPSASREPRAVPAVSIEGEPDYLRTIATLNRTVDENKDFVLSASERVEFERNLAVVNHSISKMRNAVKNDPGNDGARKVLSSSYKNKIDLLNSVANRTQPVSADD